MSAAGTGSSGAAGSLGQLLIWCVCVDQWFSGVSFAHPYTGMEEAGSFMRLRLLANLCALVG